MFPHQRLATIYQDALDRLSDPVTLDREVWLNGYDDSELRTEKYARNGLFWGYPRNLVFSLTGQDPENTGGGVNTSAFFVGTNEPLEKQLLEHPKVYPSWRRVPYREIHESIEKTLLEELEKAKAGVVSDEEHAVQWAALIAENFPKFVTRTLRFDVMKGDDGPCLLVVIGKPERFLSRGFGVFLENIQPGEVSCSAAALEWLRGLRPKDGLDHIIFFPTQQRGPDGIVPQGPIFAGMKLGPATVVRAQDACGIEGFFKDWEPLLELEEA